MEIKEQKIERLKKRYKMLDFVVYGSGLYTGSELYTDEAIDYYRRELEFIGQQLKELEDGNKTSKD